MNSSRFITTRVMAAVKETFAAESRVEAFGMLAATPLREESSAEVGEQILLGLVRTSKGDMKHLRTSVEYFDARDGIYAFHGVDWDEKLKDSRL